MTSWIQLDEEETGDITNPPSGSFKYFHDETSDRLACKGSSGTTATFVTTADIAGLARFQGMHDASTGVPTTGTYTPIKAGDWWRVSVGGTITGIQGEDVLEAHDAIYALADGASTAAQFWGQQGNVDFEDVATSGLHSDLTLDDGTNPHGTTKSDVGLSNVPNTDATQRSNHTGTQTASTISDFDTEVSNNADVAANTAKVSADGSIDTHSDVDTTTNAPSNGDVLEWDGSDWVPATPSAVITDHGGLSGLGDDDHPQYHNDTRGDLRYYTKTQLDAGQLDNRYYTETETDNLLDDKADETIEINSVAGQTTGGGDLTANRTIGLADTAVTPGSYTYSSITVDQKGRVTAASSGLAPSGEANTASNVGSGGVGVFKQKSGVNLEFKNINAGSNKVTVTNDGGNDEIDIDVNEANVDHDSLSGFVSNEHIDHSSVTLTAGDGLSGGGDITTNRSFAVNTSKSVTTASDNVELVGDSASPGNNKLYGTNGSGTKGWYDQPGVSVFGDNFARAVSDGLSSTNSTTYQQKVTLSTGSIPAGTYRIGWSYSWSHGATNTDFEARIQWDNTTDVMLHAQEPKDAGTDQLHRNSGFGYITTVSTSTHSIDLDYRTSDSDDTAYIQRANLEFWRVS